MENQKSQSDPPENAMPNSSSQPRDDQPNQAGFTSDQSESDFLIPNIDEVLKNYIESFLATDTAEATSNPSTLAQPHSGQSHSQSGNHESALFPPQMFELPSILSTDQSQQHKAQAPIVDRSSGQSEVRNNTLVSSGQLEYKQYTFPKRAANADQIEARKKLKIDGGVCEPDVTFSTNPNGNQHSPTTNKPADTPSNAVQAALPESLNSATNIPSNATEATGLDRIPETADQTNLLFKDIESINSRLVNTQLEFLFHEDCGMTDSKGRHAVVCNYKDSSLKVPRNIIPVLKLKLLVPVEYPMASPIIFDFSSNDPRTNAEDLHIKAHTRLSEHILTLMKPISLEEFAKAWDASASAVLAEYMRHWTHPR